ncbi:MAG: flagellar motor protein [Anaerolineae bacterium]|nr:flagellar motor protein [Anaerolineae bacterium]
MEIATVIGLVLGLGAMIGSMVIEGGNPMSLLNVPASVIVFGGCAGALFVAFPLKQVLRLPATIAQCFQPYKGDPQALIDLFVKLADQARRDGLLSLEEEARKIEDDFIKKGVMLIVDGVDPAVVQEVMEIDTSQVAERHKEGIEMLKALGGYGPTMGIIGTVMGLVNVLSRLSDPENLGHSIATAFIATLYGVASANILWLPMANKLKQKNQSEMNAREVALQGVLAVQAGENPRIVREKLESFLAPKLRGHEGNAHKE